MAFSGAQSSLWNGSTLLLDAGGAATPGSIDHAGPTSLDALLFDADDADPVPTCSPRMFPPGLFAGLETTLTPVATTVSTGHILKTYPSSETYPHIGKRRAKGPVTRGKWPWPLRSERRERVPQKEQRARLAQDVQEMEAFVAQLSASRSLATAGDHETIAAVRVQREREAKREAECHNQRLRQLNAEHAKRLKRIDHVVTQSLSDYDELQVSEGLQYDEKADAALYRELLGGQDEQLRQIDAVFRAAGITHDMKDEETAQVVTDDRGGAYIRFVQARLVPFPVLTIMRAMKRHNQQYAVYPDQLATSTQKTLDPFGTVAIKARFMLRHADTPNAKPVPLDSRGIGTATRVGRDGVVHGVWAGQGDWPPEYTPGGVASLPIREKGWVRMRELRSRGGQVVTLTQSCLHMRPGVTGDGASPVMSPECVAMLADMIIPSYTHTLHGRQQTMENAYMDELMREQKAKGGGPRRSGKA